MIFIHELGHFLSARASGVGVKEFAIGMGPKIFTRVSKKTQIRYSLRLFPIGGFVSMVGEDEESESLDAFGKAKIYKRMIIIVSGAAMNLLLGFLIMLIITSSSVLITNVVDEFYDESMSDEYGLMSGDEIVKIGNTNIHIGYEMMMEIGYQGDEAVDITVIRNGERILLENVIFPTETENGMTYGQMDFRPYGQTKNIGSVIKYAYFQSVSTVKLIWQSLVDLVFGRLGMEALSGPVGITESIGDAAKTSTNSLLLLCAAISLNLGIMNLLPFPALDGGRFVFLIIEAVRGKPVNKNVEAYIHFIGIIALFALMIFITMKDVWGLIAR